MATNRDNTKTINLMNSFLRGELSAVETYQQCIDKLEANPNRATLEECQRSHQQRVDLLRDWIVQHGGEPAESSGAWGGFVKLIQGGAKIFGEKAAVAALEEGEDHGRDEYQRELENLDVEARELIETRVLPEQLRTHDTVARIKNEM